MTNIKTFPISDKAAFSIGSKGKFYINHMTNGFSSNRIMICDGTKAEVIKIIQILMSIKDTL